MTTIGLSRVLPALFLVIACACEKNYYTTNITGGEIDTLIIGLPDTTAPPVVRSITTRAVGLEYPTGLAFSASGNLLVAQFVNPGTIRSVSPLGVVDTFATGGSPGIPALEWIAIDSSGVVYVSCQDFTVKRAAPGGGTLTTFVPFQANPTGLTFDRSGNLYVGNVGDNTVKVYNSSGAHIRTITDRVNGPVGLAFDPGGNLFIANRFDSVITRVDSGGAATDFARIPAVNALICDNHGNLYAAEADDYRGHIFFITPKGSVHLIAATYSNPGGLALDTDGNLYVASWSGGIIQKLSF